MATLGYTSHAATGSAFNTGPLGLKVTPTEDGTITKITVWIKTYAGGGCNFRVAVYADSSGTPGAKLSESASATAISASDTEYDCSISQAITNGTPVWLAMMADTGNAEVAFDAGPTHQASLQYNPSAYPTWPGTWAEDYALDRNYTIYATYTPGGSAVPVFMNQYRQRRA